MQTCLFICLSSFLTFYFHFFIPFFASYWRGNIIFTVFESATSFNIDVSKWNVKKVRSMANMFIGTSAFTHVWCNDDWVNSISDTDFDTTYDGDWKVINQRGSGKVLCCNPGQYYNASSTKCHSCSVGKSNSPGRVANNLPQDCETCSRNTFGPIQGLPQCSDCEADQFR